jgi:uncharacterized protein (DUF305 family)
MNRTTVRRALLTGAVAFAALAVAAGCSGHNMSNMPGMSGSSSTTAPATSGASFNQADVQFAQMMIPHHQQAVEMATLAQTRASDSEVKQLAAQIKAAQAPEIKVMTGWLTSWGQPTTQPSSGHNMPGMSGTSMPSMPGMSGTPMPGMSAMPGIMSDQEMAQLQAAKGVAFDRMFVQMMITHHNGAIQMARDEQANGSNVDAKKLATTIEQTQTAEVQKLQKNLARL